MGFNVSKRTCAADVDDGLTPERVAIVPEGLFELLDVPEYLERSADISFAKSVFKLPVPEPEFCNGYKVIVTLAAAPVVGSVVEFSNVKSGNMRHT